jgi:nickel/cobalt transporter (NicO) family protein
MPVDTLSWNLLLAALGLAVVHTAVGPDHTLPFVMLARARNWSLPRTLTVTALCGLGHVGSSLLLGGIGLALGYGISHVEGWEGIRGDLAAWGLVAFGMAYAVWGVRRALRRRKGMELHDHDGHVHLHTHGARGHHHDRVEGSRTTFWILFTIFVLGPCEPLIPLFVLPASVGRWGLAAMTGIVFGIATIVTMLALVALMYLGVTRLPLGMLERWSHALAGGIIASSGLAILFLGL